MAAVEKEQQQRLLVTENELKSSWTTLRLVRQVAIEAMASRQKARRLGAAFAALRCITILQSQILVTLNRIYRPSQVWNVT